MVKITRSDVWLFFFFFFLNISMEVGVDLA